MKYFAIDEAQLKNLAVVARRLHTEDRLNGDEMRDIGHAVADVVRVCLNFQLPDEEEKKA